MGEISERIGDGLHGTPEYSKNGEYFFINGNNLIDGEIILNEKTKSCSESEYDKYKKNLSNNTILISINGTIGNLAFYKGENVILGKSACYINIKSDVDKNFIYYALKSSKFQNYIKSQATGSTIKNVSLKLLRDYVLELPDIIQQKRISKILSNLDDKIRINNQINQTLESIAQAIFKSWFIDFDPVRAKMAAKQEGQDPELAAMCTISGKSEEELQQMAKEDFAELQATAALFPDELVESELGEVPKGWEVKRFEDLLDTLESGTRPKGGVSGISEGMPSVGAENILGLGIYNYGKEKFVPYSFFEKMKKGKVQDYDVLLYKDGGKPGEFKPRVSMFGKGFPYEKFSINEHVFRIRSNKLGQFFLYFKIKSPDILSQLASKGAKAAIPGINQNDVKSLDIIYPNNEVLDKFNFLVLNYVDLILKNSVESKCLAKLRDGLLPKLLSGEVALGGVIDA
nr:restriction endonuclease subunit S [Acinetobacter haemolyticus]